MNKFEMYATKTNKRIDALENEVIKLKSIIERLIKPKIACNSVVGKSIKEAGKIGITAKNLSVSSRSISRLERNKLISDMITNNVIHVEKKKIAGSRKSTTVYYWR